MKRQANHSVSKQKYSSVNEKHQNLLQENVNPISRASYYERRCHTPSILTQNKKSKSKAKQSKQKLSQKKAVYYSIKNFKPQAQSAQITHNYQSNLPLQSQKQQKSSPFKHKHTKNKSTHLGNVHLVNSITGSNSKKDNNRQTPNLHNVRHVRNIQSQLSHFANMSDSSVFRGSQHKNHQKQKDQSVLIQSASKKGYSNHVSSNQQRSKKHISSHMQQTIPTKEHPLMTQGKTLMKSHHFPQAIQLFTQLASTLSSTSPWIIQCNYLTGVCNFHLGHYQNVVKQLTQVVYLNEEYRKNVYLFLGIAYKKLGMIQEALLVLGKALTLYPNYLDVLLFRAKILSKQKRFYDSVQDLNKCIKLDPQNIQAYISKADCLRNLTQYKEAINIYTEVVGKQRPNLDILLKRAITYIQNQQISSALKDLGTILSAQPKNSQAYLFKGLAYTKLKNYNESILSYEQSIKFNTSKKATTKALYEIAKLKIQLGDFYGAGYTLERGLSLDIDMKVIQKLKIFIDGATFIMKKKFKRGIQLLNILGKKQHLNEMIRSFLYSFRSYGHYCLNKYASALSDVKQLIKCGFVLDSASQYNMILLEGIIKCQNNQFTESMQKFQKACQLRPEFGDPQMYKALCKICEYNRTPKLRQKNSHLLHEALNHINKALQKQQNFNYFYLCALVLYILKDYQTALANLQQAIQRSDDHVLKHFYLRALINAMQQKYQQCFTDLNNVLSISKDLRDKQKQKGQNKNNEQDKQKDKFYGEFQDLLNQQKQILEVYLNRAKCYLIFGQKKKAFQDLQTFIGQKPMDSSIHLIAGKLLFSIGACEDAVKAFNYSPNIDKNKQSLLARVKCYILLKQLNLSIRDMQKLMQLGDKQIQFDFCCLSALKQASKGQEQNFKSAMQKINIGESLQNKNGHIFTLGDMFFYKGVIFFMLGDYESARKYMTKSKNIKKINNQIQQLLQNKEISEEQYEQLFQNKIFTDKQIDYNLGVCELMLGNTAKAKQYFKSHQRLNLLFEDGMPGNEDQEVSLTPFPTSNRLCSIFPELEYQKNKRLRLSFCLPAVHPLAIVFQIQYKLIEQVSMASIQSRPDAPWIKRNKFGVVFTSAQDLLRVQDVDIKTQRSNSKQQQQCLSQQKMQQQHSIDLDDPNQHYQGSKIKNRQLKIQQQQQYDDQKQYLHKFQHEYNNEHQNDDQYNSQIEQHCQNVHNSDKKTNLREMFELDASVKERLNKLLKNKAKNS